MSIEELRNEMDHLNHLLILLFAKRMQLAEKIGRCKRKQHLPIVDTKREAEELKGLIAYGKNVGLDENTIIALFSLLFELAKEKQKKTS